MENKTTIKHETANSDLGAVSGVFIAMLLFICCASFKSYSQNYKRDSTYALLLLADTSKHYRNETNWTKSQKVWWEYGYIITETHNTLENMNPPVSREDQLLYGHDYIKLVGYYIENFDLNINGLVVFNSIPINDR